MRRICFGGLFCTALAMTLTFRLLGPINFILIDGGVGILVAQWAFPSILANGAHLA